MAEPLVEKQHHFNEIQKILNSDKETDLPNSRKQFFNFLYIFYVYISAHLVLFQLVIHQNIHLFQMMDGVALVCVIIIFFKIFNIIFKYLSLQKYIKICSNRLEFISVFLCNCLVLASILIILHFSVLLLYLFFNLFQPNFSL